MKGIILTGYSKMEEELKEAIGKMVEECKDVALLDLICQLLKKEVHAKT